MKKSELIEPISSQNPLKLRSVDNSCLAGQLRLGPLIVAQHQRGARSWPNERSRWDGATCQTRTRRSHYCFQLRFYFQQRCSFLTMSQSEPIPFRCPGCEAEYKLVTIEICESVQGKLRCLNCDAMFPAGEGRVAFKYFLEGRPGGRNRRK